MKPLKIAAFGLAALLAVVALALVFGVPVGFLAKFAQDQIATKTGYRMRIDGETKLALRPEPTLTFGRISVYDGSGRSPGTSIVAESARVSLSLASVVAGRPHMTEVTIVKPVVRMALQRQPTRRAAATGVAVPEGDAPGAPVAPAGLAIDRLTIEDGAVVMTNPRDHIEMRIDRIELTGVLATEEARLEVRAVVGDQPVHLQAAAKAPLAGFDGANVPVELSFEAPGVLEDKVTGTADLRTAASVLRINGLAGTIGTSPLNGWVSVDFSGKPVVKADFDVQRLALAASPAASGHGAAAAPRGPVLPSANASWSSREVRLAGLNYIDADVRFSAAELSFGSFRAAPVAMHVVLANGALDASLSRTGLYGGQIDATVKVDASGETPVHTAHIELAAVRALPLLTDIADFGALDGSLRAKIDVRASGSSETEVVSSLAGSGDVRIQDGQILGINVPKMIRTLTAKTLFGWQEDRTEKTDLSDLSARFQVKDGRATTSDLRLLGPLVRVTGGGTIDLGTRTLQYMLDPKLVASLEGQGGASDPLGFGVPVIVEGSWSDPHIYPDVTGILSDPDGAYAKLHALGQGLFGREDGQAGKQPGGDGLDALVQGLGTMLGPKNDRKDSRGSSGARPSDRPDGTVGDFLRDLFGR